MATDLPPDQRISDEDILHTVNTFMFAGSDTSSLAVTWTLFLLAKHPEIQTRLRTELLNIMPPTPLSRLTPEEFESLYTVLSDHHLLNNVVREVLRLIPPLHSTMRVATRDDEIPTSSPVHLRDGSISEHRSISVQKGDFVQIPVEAFHLDKDIWGDNAWEFECVRDHAHRDDAHLFFFSRPVLTAGIIYRMLSRRCRGPIPISSPSRLVLGYVCLFFYGVH